MCLRRLGQREDQTDAGLLLPVGEVGRDPREQRALGLRADPAYLDTALRRGLLHDRDDDEDTAVADGVDQVAADTGGVHDEVDPARHRLPYRGGEFTGVAGPAEDDVGAQALDVLLVTVAPGLTRTPATAYQPDEAFDAALATQALPRPLVPDDVAATVGFLAGDAAEALTGQVLTVDGGSLLR